MTITKRWIVPGALALALSVGAGALVLAQVGPGGPGGPYGPGFGPGFGPGRMGGPGAMMMPMRQLGLTDAQREQVKGIMQSHRDEAKAIGERLGPARKALQDAITQAPVNEGLIRQRAAELAAVEADAAVARARLHAEVFAILTPEQQKKATELRAQMGQHMQQMQNRGARRQPRQGQGF